LAVLNVQSSNQKSIYFHFCSICFSGIEAHRQNVSTQNVSSTKRLHTKRLRNKTFCYRRRCVYRRFVWKRFVEETFCRGDVLYVRRYRVWQNVNITKDPSRRDIQVLKFIFSACPTYEVCFSIH
jgi:hypothetical protein